MCSISNEGAVCVWVWLICVGRCIYKTIFTRLYTLIIKYNDKLELTFNDDILYNIARAQWGGGGAVVYSQQTQPFRVQRQ